MQTTFKNIAYVAAALIASTAVASNAYSEDRKGECHGVNECKGQTACATASGNACAGQNACKGQGWLALTKSECSAKGGEFKAK